MSLLKLKDEDKVKAFDMIVKKHGKDGSLSEFGKDVQDILRFLRELNGK